MINLRVHRILLANTTIVLFSSKLLLSINPLSSRASIRSLKISSIKASIATLAFRLHSCFIILRIISIFNNDFIITYFTFENSCFNPSTL